ncbi:helix-turn-helix transcriptional regulator [Actinomadura viridis]|uniref:Transcriptional regulator with XRE-family HTH domain n=1 Tax=Actinomadura viridis TaxID=58110 RepID=A0A931GRH3_9ACTN|nr:helix-turn-helix transcriptional regulator [Actinomadura viridis]MBG6092856.1 transcriptional regulator with XRE-family HTH domain [Actinomadura viridis]
MVLGPNPTVRGRRLAADLRRLREERSLTIDQVAGEMDWHPTKLSRIETARRSAQPSDVRALLHLYEVAGEERESLIKLARAAREKGWWHSYRDVLSEEYAHYIGFECEAAAIHNFEPLVIPGLLQTPEYARALMRGGPYEIGEQEIERRVEVRLKRQGVLDHEDPPRLWLVMDEAALRRPIGGVDVMQRQLRHLIQASVRSRLTIQVVPFSAGAHPGTTGSFIIMTFPDQTDRPVVYMETLAGDLYLERESEIEVCTIAFERLCASALSREDSLALIAEVIEEY